MPADPGRIITRLETKSRDLWSALAKVPPQALSRVASAVAKCALEKAALEGDLYQRATEALSSGAASLPVWEELAALQSRLDNEYLDELNEEPGGADELSDEAQLAFQRSRALSAVVGFTQASDAISVSNIVYEALFGGCTEADLLQVIRFAAS